ncbi:BTB domain-containing protein [Favolaschia claudopus]|uniref:BTB domain-containing protein n=1 Tax=Favolaschia claudopus TaxID=2862362 RepID=A0AAW0AZC5_9AGAR
MHTTHDANQTQSEGAELTRVEDLWFPTDIIVIRAESTIFRVFSGVLAAKSSVFRDMIAFPQPSEADTENMDGHPVVRLHDKPEDVEVFLRALYDSEYFMPPPSPVTLQALLAILRLSHKYDVPYLHRRALDHLNADGFYRRTYEETKVGHIDYGIVPLMASLSVIIAATQVKADWLLPYTYYCAATYSPEELSQHVDGETHDCALKALTAHAHLVRGAIDISCYLTTGPSTCTTIMKCPAARKASLSQLLETLSDSYISPLPPSEDLQNFEDNGACSNCLADAKTKQHEAASKFWDELPQIFGLPPWKDLRAMKRAAMGQDDESSDEESGDESD